MFDRPCKNDLYSVKFNLIDLLLEEFESSENLQTLDAFQFERFNAPFKAVSKSRFHLWVPRMLQMALVMDATRETWLRLVSDWDHKIFSACKQWRQIRGYRLCQVEDAVAMKIGRAVEAVVTSHGEGEVASWPLYIQQAETMGASNLCAEKVLNSLECNSPIQMLRVYY